MKGEQVAPTEDPVKTGAPVILGARILCFVCAAMPFPCCEEVRQDFTLRRFDDLGRPAESPAKGLWSCGLHTPQRSAPKPRVARVAPVQALADLENVLGLEIAHLNEAIADDGVTDALGNFRKEVERGLASLRKAMQP